LLWKNTVFSAFYAVFLKWEPQKPTKIAIFALADWETPVFSGGVASSGESEEDMAAWDNELTETYL
jgi:hypothetical protein